MSNNYIEVKNTQTDTGTVHPKPVRTPLAWRPERSSLTRREFQQLAREMLG